MITTLLSDFSRVLLFPKNELMKGDLNTWYRANYDKSSFHFFNHYVLNEELLEYFKNIKDKFTLNIFTSGNIYDASEIKDKIHEIFQNVYEGNVLNLDKKVPSSYYKVCEMMNVNPSEVFFFDDTPQNIEAAHNAGLMTHLYSTNIDLIEEINNLNK